jgi:hypothetical protein
MWRVIVVISSRLTGMGHVAVTLIDWIARTRACIVWTGATVNDIISFTLSEPLSSFPLPVLLALTISEVSLVITFRLSIVADIDPLVIMNLD